MNKIKVLNIAFGLLIIAFCYVERSTAQVTFSGRNTRFPEELTRNSEQHSIMSSHSTSTFLFHSKTDYYISVGKLRSTKILDRTDELEYARERIRDLDFAGGLWNTIFRGGGEFQSSRTKVSGRKNIFVEFSLKIRKEITGTIVVIGQYAYSGDVRQRFTPNSSSVSRFNVKDTLAFISRISLPSDSIAWQLEVLLIRGDTSSFSGNIFHGSDRYVLDVMEPFTILKSFIMKQEENDIAAFEFGLSNQLFLLRSLMPDKKVAISCLVAALKTAFDGTIDSQIEK